MADEIDDQAAMAQWASQNPPGAFGEGDAGGGGGQ
jgi:flagellar motor switch protein FliM